MLFQSLLGLREEDWVEFAGLVALPEFDFVEFVGQKSMCLYLGHQKQQACIAAFGAAVFVPAEFAVEAFEVDWPVAEAFEVQNEQLGTRAPCSKEMQTDRRREV